MVWKRLTPLRPNWDNLGSLLLGGALPRPAALERRAAGDDRAFLEELREHNRALLMWSIAIFNVFCVAWSGLDYALAPRHWRFFLALRLLLVLSTSAIVFGVHRPVFRRRTFEAWWLCAVCYGVFIAPTVPLAGESLNAFVVGYVLIILTIGFLPVWPVRWIASALAAFVTALVSAYLLWPNRVSATDGISVGAVMLSAIAVSITCTAFKFSMLRRDHALRAALVATTEKLAEANDELVQLNHTDQLTGVRNRRSLDLELPREFARSKRSGSPLSCLMVDIDHFKQINDTYGHQRGDEVLRFVAAQLAAGARQVDVVARFGGEEFTILMPGTTNQAALLGAERLLADIAAASEDAGCPRRITASIGIASTDHPDACDVEMLMKLADGALYRAKREGRDRALVALWAVEHEDAGPREVAVRATFEEQPHAAA